MIQEETEGYAFPAVRMRPGELCDVRPDRMECDCEEVRQAKELKCYDAHVFQTMLLKIFNLRDINDFFRKKCFQVQLNLRNESVK